MKPYQKMLAVGATVLVLSGCGKDSNVSNVYKVDSSGFRGAVVEASELFPRLGPLATYAEWDRFGDNVSVYTVDNSELKSVKIVFDDVKGSDYIDLLRHLRDNGGFDFIEFLELEDLDKNPPDTLGEYKIELSLGKTLLND